jgi:hypothetical protein
MDLTLPGIALDVTGAGLTSSGGMHHRAPYD